MKIVITDSNFPNNDPEKEIFSAAGLDVTLLSATDEDLLKQVGQTADAVLVQFAPLTESVLREWSRCKLIVRYGIGVDNVDVDAATRLGIQVCNVSGYCLDEVADHTVALILAVSRKLLPSHLSIKEGKWEVEPVVNPLPKLENTQVGIIGLGRIGERVVSRLKPFKYKVSVYDPFLTQEAAREKGIEKEEDLKQLLEQSDIISLHLPLQAETHHLLNTKSINWMKKTASVVNTSRGALIDTDALAKALNERRLGFAALDVFEQEPLPLDHPLRDCDRILLTPHSAYYSDSSMLELQRSAAQEVVRWSKGKLLYSPVNKVFTGV